MLFDQIHYFYCADYTFYYCSSLISINKHFNITIIFISYWTLGRYYVLSELNNFK